VTASDAVAACLRLAVFLLDLLAAAKPLACSKHMNMKWLCKKSAGSIMCWAIGSNMHKQCQKQQQSLVGKYIVLSC
jgi:hypothetical protein